MAERYGEDCRYQAVFVGGSQRSGTTMLGAMLGSSPDVITVPESQFLLESLAEEAGGKNRAMRGWSEDFRLSLWGLEADAIRRAIDSSWEGTGNGSVASAYEGLVGAYARRRGGEGRGERRSFVDHTPESIRYYARLIEAFPSAKFVHLIRDPRAVYNSVKRRAWGPNTPHVAGGWWLENLARGFAAEALLGSEVVYRVRYEDLVESPASSLQPLCEWLGVRYSEEMAAARGFEPPGYTRAQHILVGEGLHEERVCAWRSELGVREVEIMEALAGDVLELLGYELAATRPKRARIWERAALGGVEVVRGKLLNRITQARRMQHVAVDSEER